MRQAVATDLLSATAAATCCMDRTRTLNDVALAMGATQYLVLEAGTTHPVDGSGIVASNWTFDSISVIGRQTITRLAEAAFAVGLALTATPVQIGDLGPFPSTLNETELRLLAAFGHREVLCFRTQAGTARFLTLMTAQTAGSIDASAARRAQLLVSYLVSHLAPIRTVAKPADPLSDRERECLFWVSEGKTTDEVSVILGVSANTAGTYIQNTIQKLGASNRAMAVAVAIRQGIL